MELNAEAIPFATVRIKLYLYGAGTTTLIR
jgi:hypothetical protein